MSTRCPYAMVSATLGGGSAQNHIAGGAFGRLSHATYIWPGLTLDADPAERSFRVYKETPYFRPRGPRERERDASACIRRHQAFALAP